MVKEFSGYGETIVPTISYVSNSQVVAIGEDIVSIYKVGIVSPQGSYLLPPYFESFP